MTEPRERDNQRHLLGLLEGVAATQEVKLQVKIEASPMDGVTNWQVEETKTALRGLGMADRVKTE